MSLGGLFAPLTMLWLALGAIALAGAAYLIRSRHRRVEVPFSALWVQVLAQTEASSLWRRLRRLLSLLLIVATLLLLLFAALDPILGLKAKNRRHVVIVVDASASMATKDGGPNGRTRFEAAKAAVNELVGGLGGDDQLLIITADTQATPLSRFSTDKARVLAQLASVAPSQTAADLQRALRTAANALSGRDQPLLVIVSDGAFDPALVPAVRWEADQPTPPGAIDFTGIDVRYLSVGETRDNVGIVAFGARRYLANKEAYEVFLEIQNAGERPAARKLVLANGATPVDTREVNLAPGATLRQIYRDIPASDEYRLTAALSAPDASATIGSTTDGDAPVTIDAFSLDDTAYALLPPRKRQAVLIVSARNEFLESAITAYSNLDAEVISPQTYESAPEVAATYDAVVFNEYTPLVAPATNTMYFAPQAARSPVPVRGELLAPRITDLTPDHPVTRWLTLGDANFDRVVTFAPRRDRGEIVLASSLREPVMVAASHDGHRQLVCGFSLSGTDLVMRVAFPVLLINSLDWFAGDSADVVSTLTTGMRQRIVMGSAVGFAQASITTPSARAISAPVLDGSLTYYPPEVGFYTATTLEGQPVDFAANLASPSESKIAPQATWTLGGKALAAPPTYAVSVSRRLWTYLVILALALVLLEWFTYHRRMTV